MTRKERMARHREALREIAERIADDQAVTVLQDLARARARTLGAYEGTPLGDRLVVLRGAIDGCAEVLTGDPEYFWSKSPDLCKGPAPRD